MSEYQYYEFQAVDRPLGAADREALRELSTRARITATSFTNSYEWGDFKGDPAKMMDRWFDLHLYLANWGSRRLMMRLPTRMVDRHLLDAFLGEVDCVKLRVAGENLILTIVAEELETEDWDDDSGWLAALAPLRAEVLAGDFRLFYLLWLTAVEADVFQPDEPEPLPGIGPLSGAHEAFADFFGIDRDLVAAAAECSGTVDSGEMGSDVARRAIAAMADGDKTELLSRLFDGDPHVAAELRAMVRMRLERETETPPSARRTVGELQARAHAIRLARERAEADKLAEERRLQAEAAEKARQTRLVALRRRGESVWQEVEDEIEGRNSTSYDKAVGLLSDLRALAESQGTIEEFHRRLHAIRERHARKGRFIERLASIK
jgi:hypothetical protein